MAKRRITPIVVLGLWAWCAAAYAQNAPHIELADRFDPGAKIVAEFHGTALDGAQAMLAWSIDGAEFEPVDGGRRVFVWAKSGKHDVRLSVTYTIQILAPDPKDPTKGVPKTLTLPPYEYRDSFIVGPETPPIPPPDPEPDPEPTPPVVAGKRTVVIVHESADQTPAQARLFTSLRSGTSAQYIASKGHNLLILDDDSVDQTGRPLKLTTELVALGDALPFLAVLDSNTGKVLHHRPLSQAANAEGVMNVLKENGG